MCFFNKHVAYVSITPIPRALREFSASDPVTPNQVLGRLFSPLKCVNYGNPTTKPTKNNQKPKEPGGWEPQKYC